MYIVIYEAKRQNAARELRVKARTYSTQELAEIAQKQVSHDFRCASWVAEVPDPPLVEAIPIQGGVLEVTPEYQ